MNWLATLLAFLSAFNNATTQVPHVLDLVEQAIANAEKAGQSLINAASPVASVSALIAAVGKLAAGTKLDPHVVAAVAANKVASVSAPAAQKEAPAQAALPASASA